VQTVEWTYHELGVHFTRSHVVEEVFCVSAHRKFSTGHLVYELLKPHFVATLALNRLARKTLLPTIEQVGMLSIDGIKRFVTKIYNNFDIISALPVNDLKKRKIVGENVNNADDAIREIEGTLPNYWYALYGLEIWRDMRELVHGILSTKYSSDTAITEDAELTAWGDEIRAHMTTFPELHGVEMVVDIVTYVIYVATVFHSAVNYLQWYYMAYSPNMPTQMVRPLSSALQESFSDHFLALHLPTKEIEAVDRQVSATLSKPTAHPMTFALSEHTATIAAFKAKMDALKTKMEAKNAALATDGRVPYHTLFPEEIANSIEI